ncbi:MAG: hypothetical protein KIS66_01190 [Fimbriimonadaceae bacterium]|nr:hypothetical protein [Fimbriimonadaceae bacterium]
MPSRSASLIGLLLGLIVIGCKGQPERSEDRMTKRSAMSLEFLSRQGCVNTPKMRHNLDSALREIRGDTDYKVIDVGDLPRSDLRRGYGTPTVLLGGNDLMGMPKPSPSAEPG